MYFQSDVFFRMKYEYFCVISWYVFGEKTVRILFDVSSILLIEIDRIHIMYIHWFLFSSGFSIKPTISLESSHSL
jgi:hypothetical protein